LSSSAAVGVSFGIGTGGAGLGFTVSASAARGNADGNDVSYTNTHVDAGHSVTMRLTANFGYQA